MVGGGHVARGAACIKWRPHLREIELLVEAYLFAERALVAAVDAAGDTVPLPDGGAARSSIAPLGSAAMRGGRL
jgi:hypothetical protein